MLDTSGFDTGLGFVDAGFDLLDSDVGVSRDIPIPGWVVGVMETLLIERYSSEHRSPEAALGGAIVELAFDLPHSRSRA